MFEDLAFRPSQVHKYAGPRTRKYASPYLPTLTGLADLIDSQEPSPTGVCTNTDAAETFSTFDEPSWLISVSSQSDPHAVAYLLSDFAEAYRESWHTGNPHQIDSALAADSLTAFTLAPIPLPTAARLHETLVGVAGYLGAMEVDAGHPALFRVLWSGLIPTHQVRDTELRFIDPLVGHELDRYDLNEEEEPGENWWWEVGATSFCWVSDADMQKSADIVAPLPDSPRGAIVRARLAQLMTLTPMEQVVGSLTKDPTRFPPGPHSFSAGRIPGADDVLVPEAKLREYALNLDHPHGKHKARLFRELLNIEAEDWQFLAEQLKRGVRRAPALREVRGDEFGVRFDVITAVKGRNGAVKPVLSGWIVRPGQHPSLVTTLLAHRGSAIDAAAGDVPILPPTSRQQWQLLWEAASTAAAEAARLVVPRPVFVTRDDSTGQWLADGLPGAGLVHVMQDPDGFSSWIGKAGHGSPGPRPGSWIAAPVHGYDRASAWVDTLAEVLGWHGIECQTHTSRDIAGHPQDSA
ncbi:hypothetical protein HA138_24050 [Mycobacteroides chelonae]|uniref:DUF6883 domain-containing protein n=1 Tax=Mycobacteroides chelonae TaxID=1774 RepID=UPI0018B08A31|nr:DUF6883 domain-containing protein [Mycobacteroides chelonae]MBF9352819.1 hypothetical protein [Mycobacteroides chelonae]